jgi:hypothetical protein
MFSCFNNQMREGGRSPPWMYVNLLQFLWRNISDFCGLVSSPFACAFSGSELMVLFTVWLFRSPDLKVFCLDAHHLVTARSGSQFSCIETFPVRGAIATHMTCLTSRSISLQIYYEDSCEKASFRSNNHYCSNQTRNGTQAAGDPKVPFHLTSPCDLSLAMRWI